MVTKVDSKKNRLKRRARVRGKVYGTAQRPRLAVFRSANHIYAQVINDDLGVTLAAASSMDKGFDGYGGNKEGARKVGLAIAEAAKKANIEEVVFDRGGFVYHGRREDLAGKQSRGALSGQQQELQI